MAAYMENKEDELLREDIEGTPASGKNKGSLTVQRANGSFSLNEQDRMAAMSESLLGKGITCSGEAQDSN